MAASAEIPSSNIYSNEDNNSEFITESNINTEDSLKGSIIETTNISKDSNYLTSESFTNENQYSNINSYSTSEEINENSKRISDINDKYISQESTSFSDDKVIINESDKNEKINKDNENSEIISSENIDLTSNSIDAPFLDSSNIRTSIITNNKIPESISDTDMISTVHNFKSTDIISSSSLKLDKETPSSNIYSTDNYSSDFIPESINNILLKREQIKKYSKLLTQYDSAVLLASGLGYLTAKEGALKIKETSYINTVAYPMGEFLHGHIAMLNKKCAVIMLVDELNIQYAIDVLMKISCMSTLRMTELIGVRLMRVLLRLPELVRENYLSDIRKMKTCMQHVIGIEKHWLRDILPQKID